MTFFRECRNLNRDYLISANIPEGAGGTDGVERVERRHRSEGSRGEWGLERHGNALRGKGRARTTTERGTTLPLPHGDTPGWRAGLCCAGQAHRCPYPRSGLPSRGLGSVPVEGFLLISRVSGGSRRHRRGIGLLVALPSKIIGLTMILPSHCRMEGHK